MKIVIYDDKLLYRKESINGGYAKMLGQSVEVVTRDNEEKSNFPRDEKEIIGKAPDILVVNIGINEVWRGYWKNDYIRPEEFEKTLIKTFKKIKSAIPFVKIIFVEPTISFAEDKKHWKRDLEGIIVAVRRAAIEVADDLVAFDGILAKAVFDAKDKAKYTVNGIALTACGEKLLAEKIADTIKEIENK